MRLFGFAVVIATGSLISVTQAAPNGCPQPGSGISHEEAIAQDPTVPATIGGCGTGKYKLHKYKEKLKEFQEQQEMTGPSKSGTGGNL
jgi:hypothetical protein